MQNFWKKCLDLLQNDARVGSEKFTTWIVPLEPESWNQETGELVIAATSLQKKDMTRSEFSDVISLNAEKANGGNPVNIVWTVKAQDRPVADDPRWEPAPSGEAFERLASSCGLMTSLSFNNFVQGMSNKVALGAAMYVASNPGIKAYNPLYIYGGVGLGKTHLMHAIGLEYLKANPKLKILRIGASDYISEYLVGIRKGSGDQSFTQKFGSLDVLLLDDVQMLGSRGGTQAAFFSTFESLVQKGKQIVLTSDTYAKHLKDVDERLRSRFAGGMSVPIDPPELETREAILMKKAELRGTTIPEEVAFFIASHFKSNVRELEGALQQVIAHAKFNGLTISVDQARTALHDVIGESEVAVEDIQRTVADYYKIRVADMRSQRRPRNIALPRQIAMYLSKELTQKSYPEIGELFGGRDHTTVLHAYKKIDRERRVNVELNHELRLLENNLKSF